MNSLAQKIINEINQYYHHNGGFFQIRAELRNLATLPNISANHSQTEKDKMYVS